MPEIVGCDWQSEFVVAQQILARFTDFESEGSPAGRITKITTEHLVSWSSLDRFSLIIEFKDPVVRLEVRSWIQPKGIDTLSPFEWWITDENGSDKSGSDINLSAVIVAAYNNAIVNR